MKISTFNGGLRIAQEPHLIKENESVALVNTDHISGVMRPMKDKVEEILGAERWGHYFTTDSTWYWSATPKDYIEFQERLYIGNRSGISTKVVGGTEYNLGIQYPTVKPTVVVTDETPEQNQITRTVLDTDTTDGTADIPGGITLKYRVANVDSSGNYYPSDETFEIRIPEGSTTNRVVVACSDTNIDAGIAMFRLFDNYWRKIYEGPSAAYVDKAYDISANDSWDFDGYQVGGLKGVYQYALTFFNSIDGTESAPVLSDEFTADWGFATVSNLEIATDPQVDQRKLYRIGGNSTAFTLVEILDNIVTTYDDEAKDDELEGSLLTAEQNFPPVANLKYLTESYAMLFAADKDKLRFTPIAEPDYWPQTYFLDFPRTITGIAKTPIGLLVFNQYETWVVTGTGPLSLSQQLLTGSQGCINGDTVVNLEGSALWVSTDGVCMSNGGVVGVITEDKMGKIDLSHSTNAVVYDERYYLMMLGLGTTLMLDLSRQVIKYINYDIMSFNKANDTLYGYRDNILYALEASDEPLQMQYSSPIYIGRGYTVPKIYKNFYMFSEGDVYVDILIDDYIVQTAEFTTKGNHQIKIPEEFTRGYSLQFHCVGTGVIYEVQWEEGNANQ